jgi:hypothetical protein
MSSKGNMGPAASITFKTLISAYVRAQSALVARVRSLASNFSQATPGKFLLLQFQMSQITQIGESISNLIAQVNSVLMASIRNQKTQ